MKNCLPVLLLFFFTGADAQWVLNFQAPNSQIIRVFSSPDDNTCWIITNRDTLYKTNNAGLTWSVQGPVSPSFVPSGLFVVDQNLAFKTATGNIFKTSNGGSSWINVFSGAANVIPVVWMKNSSTGIMAYNGALYLTNDGGDSWSTAGITQPPLAVSSTAGKGIIYNLGDTIWVTQNNGGVVYSTNYGSSWNTPSNTGLVFSGWGAISFENTQYGIAIKQNSPFVYVTSNGGSSWTSSDNSLGANEDVLSYRGQLWYIPNSADHFYVKYSADHGSSWTQQLNDPTGFEILDHSRNGSYLWAGTSNGKLYRYTVVTSIDNPVFSENSFSLYPNPSNGYFLLRSKDDRSYYVRLIDQQGCVVSSFSFSGRAKLFGNDILRGAYIAEISYKGKVIASKKIIKW